MFREFAAMQCQQHCVEVVVESTATVSASSYHLIMLFLELVLKIPCSIRSIG